MTKNIDDIDFLDLNVLNNTLNEFDLFKPDYIYFFDKYFSEKYTGKYLKNETIVKLFSYNFFQKKYLSNFLNDTKHSLDKNQLINLIKSLDFKQDYIFKDIYCDASFLILNNKKLKKIIDQEIVDLCISKIDINILVNNKQLYVYTLKFLLLNNEFKLTIEQWNKLINNLNKQAAKNIYDLVKTLGINKIIIDLIKKRKNRFSFFYFFKNTKSIKKFNISENIDKMIVQNLNVVKYSDEKINKMQNNLSIIYNEINKIKILDENSYKLLLSDFLQLISTFNNQCANGKIFWEDNILILKKINQEIKNIKYVSQEKEKAKVDILKRV